MSHSMFPRSWPGRYQVMRRGSPAQRASAIVPGPALVTTTSGAVIHSAMLVPNPRHAPRRPPRHVGHESVHAHRTALPVAEAVQAVAGPLIPPADHHHGDVQAATGQ